MNDQTRDALLKYLQRECAYVAWVARDQYESFTHGLTYSRGHVCWNCEQGTHGLQMAAADWFALIEAVRDDRMDDIKPADRDAMWSGFRTTAAGERLAADAELAWFRAREQIVRRVVNSQESFPDDYYAAKALDKWEAENPKP
jgi:hypothetical protein